MEKDKTPDRERLQAFKLVRKMVEVDPSLMPRAIIQAIVGIAETREDHLSRAALQILLELGTSSPLLLSSSLPSSLVVSSLVCSSLISSFISSYSLQQFAILASLIKRMEFELFASL
jgi:hypothetical protein